MRCVARCASGRRMAHATWTGTALERVLRAERSHARSTRTLCLVSVCVGLWEGRAHEATDGRSDGMDHTVCCGAACAVLSSRYGLRRCVPLVRGAGLTKPRRPARVARAHRSPHPHPAAAPGAAPPAPAAAPRPRVGAPESIQSRLSRPRSAPAAAPTSRGPQRPPHGAHTRLGPRARRWDVFFRRLARMCSTRPPPRGGSSAHSRGSPPHTT